MKTPESRALSDYEQFQADIKSGKRVLTRQRKVRPGGAPTPDCLTCPMFEDCPLQYYVSGCVFRAIYLAREATNRP